MPTIEYKIMTTYTYKHLQELLAKDTSPTRPKKLNNRSGKPTKKALSWNLRMLKENKTTSYLDENFVFNTQTHRMVKRKNATGRVIDSVMMSETKNDLRTVKQIRTQLKEMHDGGRMKMIVDLTKISMNSFLKVYAESMTSQKIAAKVLGSDDWIALSPANVNQLLNADILKGDTSGSDQQFLMRASKSFMIELEAVDHWYGKEMTKDKIGGGFFKHYHTLSGVDLSRYDVYSDKPKDGYRDNCLYKCFESWNLDATKLSYLKTTIQQSYVPTNKLKMVANAVKCRIKLNKVALVNGKETTKTVHYGLEGPEMPIATFDNHYFLIEKTNITKFALENYAAIKDLRSWHNITGYRDGKPARRNNRGVNSLELMRGLFKHKHLKPIPPADLLDTQFWNNELSQDCNLEYDKAKSTRPVQGVKNSRTDFHRVFYSCTKERCDMETEKGVKATFKGENCHRDMASFLIKINQRNLLLISSNAKHDLYYLSKHLYRYKPFERGGQFMCGSATLYLKDGSLVNLQLVCGSRMKVEGATVCELRQAYDSLRVKLKTVTGLDLQTYNTLPSLANDFLKATHCYEGCYEISGVPQQFMQQCVVGGKVMCRDNQKQRSTREGVCVLDANSLHAEGMSRNGFVKGTPKVIPQSKLEDAEWLAMQTQYFVQIEGLTNPEPLPFPLTSATGAVRKWSNVCQGKLFHIDKHTAREIAEHQPFKYRVIKGYYFDEGENETVCDVVSNLYKERQTETNHHTRGVYKAILTACFGHTLLKANHTTTVFIPIGKNKSYFSKNYNYIKSSRKVDRGYLYTMKKSVANHFNLIHIGCSIMSQSKSLMNKVMSLAKGTYYTDTDSLHLPSSSVAELEKTWKKKYDTDLIGVGLGQFKVETDADKALYLGKKSYVLASNDVYKMRMKAIPEQSLIKKADSNYGGCVWQMFEGLYQGDRLKFLLSQDQPWAEGELKREVQFA